MSASYILPFAREIHPGLLDVTLVQHPRRYIASFEGRRYHEFGASVTQITSNRWTDSDTTFESTAMAIGTEVHEAIDRLLAGCPVETLSCDEAEHAYQAFKDWRTSNADQLLAREAIVCNFACNYAGTLDSLWRCPCTGRIRILDNKTGSTWRPQYGAQLAGLDLALRSLGHPGCDEGVVLLLNKDGAGWQEVTVWNTPEKAASWALVFMNSLHRRNSLEAALAHLRPVRRGPALPVNDDALWAAFAQ